MDFDKFVKSVLTVRQSILLKKALQIGNIPVHFYGTGIGKSTITTILKNAGYIVTEAGDYKAALGVPDRCGCICFCITQAPEKLILGLTEAFDKNCVNHWVWNEGF